MAVRVEPYSEKDLPEMVGIWNQVVEAGQSFPQEEIETLESGRQFFASQSHCSVARNEQGQVIGLYILHPNNTGRCGHICNASYAVACEARGTGTGKMLVEDSLAVARKLGFRIMQFNAVASDNLAANTLYKKLGFIGLGTIPGGFRRPDGSYKDINLYYRPL